MKNKLKKIPVKYQRILHVVSALGKKKRVRVYLVGGVVRDLMLGKAIFDLDIVVEGDAISFAHAVADHFKVEFRKHHSFGTATVYFGQDKLDFARARKEHYTHNGALPRVAPATLKEDLYRRDFTINAMAISLNDSDYGVLVDYYGGVNDLEKGCVKVLYPESFLDDPTRLLRAVRFEQRFGFKIEKTTFRLMKEAVAAKALSWINLHRIRGEVVLLLSETKPIKCLNRVDNLFGFSFLDRRIKLNKDDYNLFGRIEKTIFYYSKKFKKPRKIEAWVLYLAVLLIKLPKSAMDDFFHRLGLKKGQRIQILAIKTNLSKVKRLNGNLRLYYIYSVLKNFGFETILFFYAYYPKVLLRKNLNTFLEKLSGIKLKIKGRDLKKLKVEPTTLYNSLLSKVLCHKIEKSIRTKKGEIEILKSILPK